MKPVWIPALLLVVVATIIASRTSAEPLTLGATTSVRDSGLLDHLLTAVARDEGLEIRAVVQSSGAVMTLAERGDVDLILVHDPAAEAAFVAAGFGLGRQPVMRNDFILVGPSDDPGETRSAATISEALARIAEREAIFASRGDNSGTHAKELQAWQAANIQPNGAWYRETGSGQGATLNFAGAVGAYALTDRATWIAFGNRQGLVEHFAGDEVLQNVYSLILLPNHRHPHLRLEAAARFYDWLTGPRGAASIAAFEIGGVAPFIPASHQ